MCEVISEVSHPNTSGARIHIWVHQSYPNTSGARIHACVPQSHNTSGACVHACMGCHTLAILNLLRKVVERLVSELTNVLPFLD